MLILKQHKDLALSAAACFGWDRKRAPVATRRGHKTLISDVNQSESC